MVIIFVQIKYKNSYTHLALIFDIISWKQVIFVVAFNRIYSKEKYIIWRYADLVTPNIENLHKFEWYSFF